MSVYRITTDSYSPIHRFLILKKHQPVDNLNHSKNNANWQSARNLYLTITQSEQIILLKQEVAPETINIKTVDQVLEKIDTKIDPKEEINPAELDNPFDSYSAVSLPTLTEGID